MEPSIPEDVARLEAVKARLINPRTISKNIDQAGRDATVKAIVAARTERHIKGTEIAEQEKALQDESTAIKRAIDRVRELIKGPEATHVTQISERLQALKNEQVSSPNPRDLLETYYERVGTTPLTVEEKKELLKPEVLEALSTDEYVALWKRLNPFYMGHVTRQGFRDHASGFAHSAGQGTFFNGFIDMIQDEGMLRSPFGATGLKGLDVESVSRFLSSNARFGTDYDIFSAQNEEEVRSVVHNILDVTMGNASKYPDKTAIHFSNNTVLDGYYGAEGGNEVFMIFPADVLASQFTFGVNHHDAEDLTKKGHERINVVRSMDNDVFVWPGTIDDPGIPIDAGLVFLPANASVDPETGSKYASQNQIVDGREVRVRIKDEETTRKFQEYLDSRQQGSEPSIYLSDRIKKTLDEFSPELLRELGFSLDELIVFRRALERQYPPEQAFETANAGWRRAENPISSKDYWERFFIQHPELKPKHIMYYTGEWTEEAVMGFFSENGIGNANTSERDGKFLGFDDNYMGSATGMQREQGGDPWLGYDEVKEVLTQAGLEHLGEKALALGQ